MQENRSLHETIRVQVVCTRHGAKVKECSYKGCNNNTIQGGVCTRHGAKVKACSYEECSNYAKKGGVCRRHSHTGCTNRRSKDAAMKDAPTTPSMHESAGDMGRSARNAAMKDALKTHKGE